MPNHFHFLIHANDDTVKIIKEIPIKINALTEGFRLLLSSYTQGINKQENRTGNLFQQKTKFAQWKNLLTTVNLLDLTDTSGQNFLNFITSFSGQVLKKHIMQKLT